MNYLYTAMSFTLANFIIEALLKRYNWKIAIERSFFEAADVLYFCIK